MGKALTGRKDETKMMLGRTALVLAGRAASRNSSGGVLKSVRVRGYTFTTPLSDLSKYYYVEVSNAERPDATRITVRGPDVDGILASMTVALAQEGASLKELHARYAETNSFGKKSLMVVFHARRCCWLSLDVTTDCLLLFPRDRHTNRLTAHCMATEKHMEGDQIEDIFYVAQHATGQQYPDEALKDLGKSLLKSLQNPMTCLSGKSPEEELNLDEDHSHADEGEQVVVVPSSGDK